MGPPSGKDDEATSGFISFLNVGQQIASETDNFILVGANCRESHLSMQRYARKFVSDVGDLEGKTFYPPDGEASAKSTFKLIPSDIKWASTFHFSPLDNVNNDNKYS